MREIVAASYFGVKGPMSAFTIAFQVPNLIRALVAGTTHKMAAWMPPVQLPEDVGTRSVADPYCWLVDLRAALAETENLLAGRSPLARWRAGAFDEIEDALLL